MTDRDKLEQAPERTFVTWPNRTGSGLAFNCEGKKRTEFVRADLFTALKAERDALREALRSIAEGNLGDAAWQANYERIRAAARAALHQTERDE